MLSVRNINPSDENSVLHNYYQHDGKATVREHILNELLLVRSLLRVNFYFLNNSTDKLRLSLLVCYVYKLNGILFRPPYIVVGGLIFYQGFLFLLSFFFFAL